MSDAWLRVGVVVATLVGCGRSSSPIHTAASSESSALYGVSGGLNATMKTTPQGTVQVELQDAKGLAVSASGVAVELRDAEGSIHRVPCHYVASSKLYQGQLSGLAKGTYESTILARSGAQNAVVRVRLPDLSMSSSVATVPARHGGVVQLLDSFAVESVVSGNGDVTLFVTQADGTGVALSQVSVPVVQVDIDGELLQAQTIAQNDALLASFGRPARGVALVLIPSLSIRGDTFRDILIPAAPVLNTGIEPGAALAAPQLQPQNPQETAPAPMQPPWEPSPPESDDEEEEPGHPGHGPHGPKPHGHHH